MNKNPFMFGMPVKGDEFYNREKETEKAVGFIRNCECFSVTGERRIGKTSFLLHVLSSKTLSEYDMGPENLVIIYLDMSRLHETTKDAFIGAIVEKIRKQTQIKVKPMNIFDMLITLVEELASNNKNLIIALDEFEIIMPILGELSYWLRSVFQSQNVTAVTASRKTMAESCSDNSASPLFNIFGTLTLGLFSKEETENMIKGRFHEGGQELKGDEVSFLANLSGGNPWLIQLLGFHYYSKKIEKDEFEDKMLDQAKVIFEGYWKHLTEEERKFLLNVETSKNEQVAHDLEKRGLVFREGEGWKVFSRLFQEFLYRKVEKEGKISKFEEIGRKREKTKEKSFDRSRTVDIFLAFLIGIASSIATPYVQQWLDLYPRFFEGLSSRIDPSLMVFVLVFVVALVVIMKFHRKSDQ